MRRSLLGTLLGIALLPVPAAPSPPPAASGEQPAAIQGVLRGTVLDSSGAPVVGASVTIEPADATTPGTAVATVSDARGEFSVNVPPGAYTVTAGAMGFTDLSRPVSVDRTAGPPLSFTLQVSGVQETVEVSAPDSYKTPVVSSATRTSTPLRDVPQAVSVVSSTLIADQRMTGMADVVRYMPGVSMAQGEGNRDTPILRGNSSTSDFFVDGVRDDVQYFRDVYNVDRVEALKGPNAMIFGRGGAGGVINRVTRQADWAASQAVDLQLGSWNNRRMTADLGRGLSEDVAVRTTGMYENSDSYRDGVALRRYGINPTTAFNLGRNTLLQTGYEHFHDERTADRGISSFDGRPVESDPDTFFGDPTRSESDATVNLASAVVEHRFQSGITLRNRLVYGHYDKFYQNVFPGAVNTAGTSVAISAYNNATTRQNVFNQTDLVATMRTGRVGHVLLFGTEFGRQASDNFRQTGYFTTVGPSVTSVMAPVSDPTISLPLEFRQNLTDADNHGVATVAAVYAQDQILLSEQVQAVVGLRFDDFDMNFTNNRSATEFTSDDDLVSPRLGLIYKPRAPISLYGSYSLSYLPRAGEQLASLSLSNQALDPEEFRNYEVGLKWDLVPSFAFTTAVYRLDRGNVAVPDPNDPTRSILVDAQRTKGVEVELNGSPARGWSVAGGYAYQDGVITRSISATAQAGAVLAQVPRHSFSLWNRYDVTERLGLALGFVSRTDVFTSTDNLVVLPGYIRVDAGVFFTVTSKLQAQVNVENLFDEKYYPNAHSNTNITPGSPRAVRMALTTRF